MDQTRIQSLRDHCPLLVVLVLFLGLALAYSVLVPLGEAADETDHFALVRFITDNHRPPLTVVERESIGKKGDASPVYHSLISLLTQHVDVSALPELPYTQRAGERFIPSDGYQRNLIFHTDDEGFPYRGIALAWHLARLPSILLGGITIFLAYFTALAILPGRRCFAAAVAAFVAFIPRFVINSAVINDDNLVVPLVAGAVYVLVRLAQGEHGTRHFVLLGALMGAAAITKYHALVLLPEVTVVLAVLAWRQGWRWRELWRRWGLVMLLFLLVAGWWFVFLIWRFNQVAELGLVRGLMATMGDPVVTEGLGDVFDTAPAVAQTGQFGWLDWAWMLFRTFWVESGALQVEATPVVYRLLAVFSLVAVTGLIWQLGRLVRRARWSEGWGERLRLDEFVLAFHVLVFFGVVVMRFVLQHIPQTAQGRHMYPALTAIAFFFILGWGGALRAAWMLIVRIGQWLGRSDRAQAKVGDAVFDRPVMGSVSAVLLTLCLVAPPLFILPVYWPYLPVVTGKPKTVPITHRLDISFAEGLNLVGYDLPKDALQAGTAVPVTLYWYAGAKQERDYLTVLCLQATDEAVVTCHAGQPVDGRYPMRAWEAGYTIEDRVNLPLSDYLAEGQYRLTLSVFPLRLDSAVAAVDGTAVPPSPVMLATIELTQSGQAADGLGSMEQPDPVTAWAAGTPVQMGDVLLSQIRQSLTIVHCADGSTCCSTSNGQTSSLSLVQDGGWTWQPVSTDAESCAAQSTNCGADRVACTYDFVVDASVRPGVYLPMIDGQVQAGPRILVNTRVRDFDAPETIPTPIDSAFGDELKFLGYDVDLSPRLPGETVSFRAYWESLRTMNLRYIATLHLLDGNQASWGQTDKPLGSHYPNLLWAPGEFVDEVYPLTIDRHTPAGLYMIEFGVYEYNLGQFDFLPIVLPDVLEPARHLYFGPIRVLDPDRARLPSVSVDMRVGEQFHLLGYDWPGRQVRRQQQLSLALYWEALSPPQADYTVFTQLVGPDGGVWAQHDNQPQGGRYPTSAWEVHDRVVDRYELNLPAEAPVGEYRLLIGMYDLASGQRLEAVSGDGSRWQNDAIVLEIFQVE